METKSVSHNAIIVAGSMEYLRARKSKASLIDRHSHQLEKSKAPITHDPTSALQKPTKIRFLVSARNGQSKYLVSKKVLLKLLWSSRRSTQEGKPTGRRLKGQLAADYYPEKKIRRSDAITTEVAWHIFLCCF
jgi:hypothetical protein